ncbi:response regulator, partial [bacterium]|nr:response regulator [bacterium]
MASTTMAMWAIAVFGPLLGFAACWFLKQKRGGNGDQSKLTAELKMSFESIRDGVLVLDDGQNVIHVNRRICEILGVEISVGDNTKCFANDIGGRLTHPGFVEKWDQLNSSDATTEEFDVEIDVAGRRRSLDVFTAPISSDQGLRPTRLWVFNDVTEKRRLDEQLVHAGKQEAIGRVVGGLSHDFNNLLTGIAGNIELAKLQLGSPNFTDETVPKSVRFLDVASDASKRAATLVQQLIGMSRKTSFALKPTDLNAIVERTNTLLRPSLGRVVVKCDLDEAVPHVHGDSTRLEQIVLGMCINARDAIGDEPGEIQIRTYVMVRDTDPLKIPFGVISIRDTGCGIPEEIRNKIYESLFTTKDGGTGLGLTMAEGVVHQHRGWMECDSEVGVGTEFRIFLRACEPEVSAGGADPGLSDRSLADRVILVTDDEAPVRRSTCELLEHLGAKVHPVADGIEAMDFLEKNDNVDLVLLDWQMPRLGGQETLQRIKAKHPDLPVVVCSGYVFDMHEIVELSGVAPNGVVPKPYSLKNISTSVMEALESSG